MHQGLGFGWYMVYTCSMCCCIIKVLFAYFIHACGTMMLTGNFWWSRWYWHWWPFRSSGQSRTWQDGCGGQRFWS